MTVIDPDIAIEFWREARQICPERARVELAAMVASAAKVLRRRGKLEQPIQYVTEAVRWLAEEGELRLPSISSSEARKRNYDYRCDPPAPCFVMAARQEAPKAPIAPRREHPWHPDLAFLAASKRLANPEVWLAIDAWLKERGGDADLMSMRERSVEIFGDEKKLDEVRCYKAFANGFITLERLRCQPVPEPLAARIYRGALTRSALVVENKDTFKSACLANAAAPVYAAVIFGEGSAFSHRVEGLKDIADEVPFSTVLYYGDIDAEGFRIAMRAERAIVDAQLSFEFRLAANLYRELLSAGVRNGNFGFVDDEMIQFLERHRLPECLSNRTGRVPQEALARPKLTDIFHRLRAA